MFIYHVILGVQIHQYNVLIYQLIYKKYSHMLNIRFAIVSYMYQNHAVFAMLHCLSIYKTYSKQSNNCSWYTRWYRFGSVIGDHSVVTSSASATQAKSDFTKTLTNLATGALKVTYNSTDVPVQSMTVTDSNGNSQSMY